MCQSVLKEDEKEVHRDKNRHGVCVCVSRAEFSWWV